LFLVLERYVRHIKVHIGDRTQTHKDLNIKGHMDPQHTRKG
jgi:hypothetical protein